MKSLVTFDIDTWDGSISEENKKIALQELENGKVLYFPKLSFPLQEQEIQFLTPNILDPKSKNISYDIRKDSVRGTICPEVESMKLRDMLNRYAVHSKSFLEFLIPHYASTLIQAKTSFRPAEIKNRKTSYKKDDTLLHVDSFPSNPTKGQRILRVFTNINQNGQPRVWKVGEPFEDVAKKFALNASSPLSGIAYLLKLLKITKDYRTPYDHYMLQIHDAMKQNKQYQETVSQEEIRFPPQSTWIVYTDQVSHAALSGQHVLEQTFHMPVKGLYNEATAPLRMLEKILRKALV